MNSEHPPARDYLPLSIYLPNSNLLEGLDIWLEMGLIDDAQVKDAARRYLSCPISIPEPSLDESPAFEVREGITRRPVSRLERLRRILNNAWQSFREELSVRWLLFLGVFLVVLSSAVLAGTQWQNISHLAQYSILWVYTLLFWSIGSWLRRQANLILTSQTLRIVSLLLIPLNFWAMDSFVMPFSTTGLILTGIASSSLLTILYFQTRSGLSLFSAIAFLVLNVFQWGWSLARFPLVAIYGGVTLTGFSLFYTARRENLSRDLLGRSLSVYGVIVLFIRSISLEGLHPEELGLAIGIFGWILPYYLTRESSLFLRYIFEGVAIFFLFIGWYLSLFSSSSLFATIISFFALQLFYKRLLIGWWSGDIIALFVVGLQLCFRLGELLSETVRENIVNAWIRWTGDPIESLAIDGITLFPYLFLWVLFSRWLYRQERSRLSRLAEYIALGFGFILTWNSLPNPVARSLNLSLSTATLLYPPLQRPIRPRLLYLAHAILLAALVSIIDTLYPELGASSWAIVFLVLMAIEWTLSILDLPEIVARNGWYFGFILATTAYILLLWSGGETTGHDRWTLGWLLAPVMLTFVACGSRDVRRRKAAAFSSIGLSIAQTLTLWRPETRAIGLVVAVLAMTVNSFYLHRRYATRLHIGSILATVLVIIWQYPFRSDHLLSLFLSPDWVFVNSLVLFALWSIGSGLQSRRDSLASLYSDSIREWGIVLSSGYLGILTLQALAIAWGFSNPSWQSISSGSLLGASLLYYSRNRWDNFAVWLVAWSAEIVAVESVLWSRRDFLVVAGVNLLLGIFVLGITRPLLSRFPGRTALRSAPLLFALMAVFWRAGILTAYTGFLSLGASILALGVGLRLADGKRLIYLSLFGITASIYESLLYQVFWRTDRNLSDRFLIFSSVTVTLAFGYWFLALQCQRSGREALFSLDLPEVRAISRVHWLFAVFWKFGSLFDGPPTPWIFATGLATAAYAILRARKQPRGSWVYLGIADLYGSAILTRFFWPGTGRYDPFYGAISCVLAFFFYGAPWWRWGWREVHWQRVAVVSPILTAFLTFLPISSFSLLSIAVFYAWLALRPGNIRWSYASVVSVNWALWRWFARHDLTDVLFYASIVGLTILYIAWVDPFLRPNRALKHYWRVAGSGLICTCAVLFHQGSGGVLPSAIGLLTVFVGLGARVRAFLLVGTLAFVLTVSYQLLVLGFEYAPLKWSIALVVGILIIVIAAIFERLKERALALWQNILEQWRHWE